MYIATLIIDMDDISNCPPRVWKTSSGRVAAIKALRICWPELTLKAARALTDMDGKRIRFTTEQVGQWAVCSGGKTVNFRQGDMTCSRSVHSIVWLQDFIQVDIDPSLDDIIDEGKYS